MSSGHRRRPHCSPWGGGGAGPLGLVRERPDQRQGDAHGGGHLLLRSQGLGPSCPRPHFTDESAQAPNLTGGSTEGPSESRWEGGGRRKGDSAPGPLWSLRAEGRRWSCSLSRGQPRGHLPNAQVRHQVHTPSRTLETTGSHLRGEASNPPSPEGLEPPPILTQAHRMGGGICPAGA